MKSNYKPIDTTLYHFSDLIEEVTEYNTNLQYGLSDIVGVTIDKRLITTIANLSQTALDKFYIVKPETFVYNPRTHGVKLGMGFNQTTETYITSWNNVAFRVKDSARKVLNPLYLWLYFNREEWDRETNYRAWGSSTIVFAWNTFLSMSLRLPPKSYQDKICEQYSIIADRIALKQRINDNLEAMTQILYQHLFIDNPMAVHWQQGLVSDVLQLQRGHDLPRDVMDGGIYPVIGSTEIIGHHSLFTTDSPAIVMGRSGNIGNPRIYFQKCWVHNTALYVKKIYSTNPIWAFFMLKNINYDEFSGGSAVPTLNRNFVHSFPITIPPLDLQNKFAKKVIPMYKMQERNKTGICILKETVKYILSAFSH